MLEIWQNIVDTVGEEILSLILGSIIIVIALAWGRHRMRNISNTWAEVAQQQGLQYVEKPMSYDYGELVGKQSWQMPGMAGEFRGRQMHILSAVGMEGKEAGRYRFESVLHLKTSVPLTALIRNSKFSNDIKARIPKDTPTQNHAVDRQFKIRSENPQFIVPILEQMDVAQWLKKHKFATANILLEGDRLVFAGAAGRYSGKPEEAMALLEMLCDFAEKIEAR